MSAPHGSPREATTTPRSEAKSGTGPPASPRGTPRGAQITPDTMLRCLQGLAQPSEGQSKFFEAWISTVFEPAMACSTGRMFIMAADLASLEVRIDGPPREMLRLANDFVTACSVPDTRMAKIMDQAQQAVQASKMTLWCRLKRMGSSMPGVDTGYIVHGRVQWLVADLLMPPVEDQDTLREHAIGDHYEPVAYSSSLLPSEPERYLLIDMLSRVPKKALMAALFFFRALGFALPEDALVRALSSAQAANCKVAACMGPKGLTRLSLMMSDMSTPIRGVAQLVTNFLKFQYHTAQLDRVILYLGAEPTSLELAAESRGWTLSLGFMS